MASYVAGQVENVGMNPGIPLKRTTSWMVYKGHCNSYSLPIAPTRCVAMAPGKDMHV